MYPVNVCQDRRGGVPPSRLVGISQPEEDPLKFRLNMGPLALAGSCANACNFKMRDVVMLLEPWMR
jgi:hypothetical protein